ncbi:helix-turn-helix domain-containing protein [Nocardia cyriacigeorgica]|uniref:Helix-turn-helix domain-containing protein n=1 Tax=Nocardia cyriacigeorgica TaxID=135487 RepID=A0ABX0CGG4_9NOCA|nr:helix-turn-helix transcriptional regulator [Nocardia cyriacigeorgica]NEW55580.1 helix-turn-helix domain-containing protein [Nocardia cyriacigeorgica]
MFVPVESNPSTLPRRVLGRRLLELRESRELSRALAARQVQMGAQTLWRLESGRSSEVKRMVINALCDLYESSAEERRELMWLAEEAKKDGWWQSYADAMVPEVEMYFDLERAANTVTTWQSALMPGLLQTAAYRRAIWEVFSSQGRAVDSDREVDLVAERQARLDDVEGFTLNALLCESVLRHRVGGMSDMADQVEHLIQASDRPNVSIRVVELTAPSHVGRIAKGFVYLEFPQHLNPVLSEPPVVYVEGYTGDLYLEKPREIGRYQAACADIRRVALDERATRGLLKALLKEYRS